MREFWQLSRYSSDNVSQRQGRYVERIALRKVTYHQPQPPALQLQPRLPQHTAESLSQHPVLSTLPPLAAKKPELIQHLVFVCILQYVMNNLQSCSFNSVWRCSHPYRVTSV